jgi:hypothetical protein
MGDEHGEQRQRARVRVASTLLHAMQAALVSLEPQQSSRAVAVKRKEPLTPGTPTDSLPMDG